MELNFGLCRITCPNCHMVLRPTYSVCSSGHLVCPHCDDHCYASQDGNSTECVSHVMDLYIFNIIFFHAHDNCQFNCGFRGRLLSLKEHESLCKNKQRSKHVKCIMESCDWKDALDNLANHVSVEHPKSSVVLTDTPDKGFSVNIDSSILLISQFPVDSIFNELYCLWMTDVDGNRYVLIEHVGHTGPEIDVDQTMNEIAISGSTRIHFKVGHVSKTDISSSKEHFTNSEYIKCHGINLTGLEGNKYSIKMKNINSHEIPRKIKEKLECEICCELMQERIPQCDNGHTMCVDCSMKLVTCPKCTARVSKSRNYFLEDFLDGYDVDCKFTRAGCTVSGSRDKIRKHTLKCSYRPSKCSFDKCDWRGIVKQLTKHFNTKHEYCVKQLCKPYFEILPKRYSYLKYVFIYDEHFCLVTTHADDFIYLAVFHLVEGKSDFQFSLTLYNHKTGYSFSISRSCCSNSLENIKTFSFRNNANNAFKIPQMFFEGSLCHESKYCYVLNIFRSNCGRV